MIGLGTMGMAIAAKLLEKGHTVAGYDIRSTCLAELTALGGIRMPSAAEAARNQQFVFLTVLNDFQVSDLLFGNDNLSELMAQETLLVIHSTIQPQTCQQVATRLEARNIHVVDAAMSGGVSGIQMESLTLMVGGANEMIQRVRPIWQAYAANIFHVGSIGTGMLVKLCNNMVLQSNRLALYESVYFARKVGIDVSTFIELLNASSGASWVTEHWYELDALVWSGGLGAHQVITQLEKDLGAALRLAEELGIHLPLVQLACNKLPAIIRSGPDDALFE
jgi:3-hydroxyisobutyrate dehydrogenase